VLLSQVPRATSEENLPELMGRLKKKAAKKSLPTRGITTRNSSQAQTSASSANDTVPGRKWQNPTAGKASTKQPRGNHLTKRDIPKILKKVMETFKKMDSESDDEVEAPTMVESQETMEEQGDNTVCMWYIV